MAENISTLLKENAALLGENLRHFFHILTNPVNFISAIDHSSTDQLVPASIFAALMSLLNLAIHLPLLRLLNVQTESVSYFVSDTVLTFAFWFIYGSCFHLVARILGARGNFASTLNSFLYLTAFFPVILVVSFPCELVLRRMIIASSDTTSMEFQLSLLYAILDSIPTLCSLALSSVLYGWYFLVLANVFSVVHGVGIGRSIVITYVGLIIWITVSALIEVPVFKTFWQAFQSGSA